MASGKQKKRKMNVWVKSGIILMTGFIISALILLVAFSLIKRDGKTNVYTSAVIESTNPDGKDEVKVCFLDENEKSLEEITVACGAAVFPPMLHNDVSGRVFLGWSQNLSCMTKDTQVYPVFDDYSNRHNVISFDTVYIDSSDKLSIQLKLGGIVDLAAFDLKVIFDDSVLHFEASTDLMSGLGTQVLDGEILLHFNASENLTSEFSLATFCFDIEDVDFIKTDLVIQLEDGKKRENGELNYIDCTMVNGTVYIY